MTKNYTPIDNLIKKYRLKDLSVTTNNKEAEPKPVEREAIKINEVVEKETVSQDVADYVKVKSKSIKLPPKFRKLGLQTKTKVKFPEYKNVKIPLKDNQVLVGLHQPVTSSFRWLAELAVYILKIAHLHLKKVHGKIVRVLN